MHLCVESLIPAQAAPQAKQAMANASNAQAKQQLNIRQQALKLTANSM